MSGESWADQVRAQVERTCAEQGVPVQVSDRSVIEQVAVLLNVGWAGAAR